MFINLYVCVCVWSLSVIILKVMEMMMHWTKFNVRASRILHSRGDAVMIINVEIIIRRDHGKRVGRFYVCTPE